MSQIVATTIGSAEVKNLKHSVSAAERRAAQHGTRVRKRRLAIKARRERMDAPPREFIATSINQYRRLYRPKIWARMSADERRRAWGFYKSLRDTTPIQDPPSTRELVRLCGATNVVFIADWFAWRRRAR